MKTEHDVIQYGAIERSAVSRDRHQNEIVLRLAHPFYSAGLTLQELATLIGFKSGTTVLYHFKRMNLPTRPRGGAIKESQAGPNNGNWKGGRSDAKDHYIRIWMPEHPATDSLGYVLEHRLVAERAIGRYLTEDEVVHHVNANQKDNRNSNLLICTQDYHAWLHQEMRRRGICPATLQ